MLPLKIAKQSAPETAHPKTMSNPRTKKSKLIGFHDKPVDKYYLSNGALFGERLAKGSTECYSNADDSNEDETVEFQLFVQERFEGSQTITETGETDERNRDESDAGMLNDYERCRTVLTNISQFQKRERAK